MKIKFKAKLVKFECCNSFHLFTRLREFKMCRCGASFYDAGDEFYSRSCGLLQITPARLKERTDACPSD